MSSDDPPPPPVACRSVNDYDTEDALRRALMSLDLTTRNGRDEAPPADDSREEKEVQLDENWDWVLTNFDQKNTVPQKVGEEIHRLKVLKSYLLLDSEREATFDRLTDMASRIFEVPIALVSLVDLGRQWFMSNHGLDVRQTPRKLAFCAHAIMMETADILEVRDTYKDSRFVDHGLVTGPPYIRFYAGAPLVSPEGYKLGTFCIIDTKPWPNGLTDKQRPILLDLASITIKTMTDRRQLIEEEDPSRLVAAAAHDLLTPLLGVQCSLSVLEEDKEGKLGVDQKQCVDVASRGIDLIRRICQNTVDSLDENNKSSLGCSQIPMLLQKNKSSRCVNLKEFVRALDIFVKAVPKQVPLTITLDSAAPENVISDDLKLIRCSLNLLANACKNTKTGSIRFSVKKKDDSLLFECVDTGKDLDDEVAESPFGTCSKFGRSKAGISGLGLFSIASQVDSLDGRYGYRRLEEAEDGSEGLHVRERQITGSLFWFSIPAVIPKDSPKKCNMDDAQGTPGKEEIKGTDLCNRQQEESYNGSTALNNTQDSATPHTAQGTAKQNISPTSVLETDNEMSERRVSSPSDTKTRESESKAPRNQSEVQEAKKALVIEDSVIVCKTLARGLNKLGYEVSEARNGREGLTALKNNLYDITLCDFVMPKMDGIECVEQYRMWEKDQDSSWRQYIIGISAHAGKEDIEKGLEAGMDGFQSKPITTKVLKELFENPQHLQFVAGVKDAQNNVSDECSTEVDMVNNEEERIENNASEQGLGSLERKGTKRTGKEADGEGDRLDRAANKEEEGFDESDIRNPKRPKLAETTLNAKPQSRRRAVDNVNCLLATTEASSKTLQRLSSQMRNSGMKATFVHDGDNTLKLLKDRRWAAVFLEEDLSGLSACECISDFRKWEAGRNRKRQENVFLVSSKSTLGEPAANDISFVQPPAGFDGVVNDSLVGADLNSVIQKTQLSSVLQGKGTSITTQ